MNHSAERGSASLFTVVFAGIGLILAALLIDGAAMMNAHLRAADIAEQAARAAADSIDVDHLRATGEVRLTGEGEACDQAQKVVSGHGDDGVRLLSCTVTADQATVRIRLPWRTHFATLIGIDGNEREAEATAGPRTGEEG